MQVSYALKSSIGPTVVTGYRAKGTAVPMLAAIFDDSGRDWKSDMPASDVLGASAETAPLIAINTSLAFATYTRTGHSDAPHVLVCFGLDGRRQWEVELPDDRPLSSVQATDNRVFVSQWSHLTAYDARTGALLFTIGD